MIDRYAVRVEFVPQPGDGILVLELHTHGVGVDHPAAGVAEATRGGSVAQGEGAHARRHRHGVIRFVEHRPRHPDLAVQQRARRSERAATPAFLEGLLTADQYDAANHGRLLTPVAAAAGPATRILRLMWPPWLGRAQSQ